MPRPDRLPRTCRHAGTAAVLALLLLGAGGRAAAAAPLPPPVVLVEGPAAPGEQLEVTPDLLLVDRQPLALDVALGGDAPGPVTVVARVAGVTVAVDGTVRVEAGAPGPSWLAAPSGATRLAPGERLDLPLGVGTVPADGVAAVRVGGGAAPATALLLAAGGPPRTRVAVAREGDGVAVVLTADAPTLATTQVATARGAVTITDRVVLPGRETRLVVPGPTAPWPVTVATLDAAGGRATARLGLPAWAVPATAAVLGALLVAGVALWRARRQR